MKSVKTQRTRRSAVRGFTLVELVVAMALISIMATATVVSMSGSKTKQEVQAASHLVASALREAQNYALTGKNMTSNPANRPCKFRARSVTGGSAIFVEQLSAGMVSCSQPGSTPDSWSGAAYNLTNGVVFSATTEVRFDVPRGEPTNPSNVELSGATSIDFPVSKSLLTAHTCIYPLGRIEEKPVGGSC